MQPELLDDLPTDDPRAVRARRDLQTINAIMGHSRIVLQSMKRLRSAPRRVIELGGGDGTLLLRIARGFGPVREPVHAILVDRHPAVTPATQTSLFDLGWQLDVAQAGVFDWLERPEVALADVTLANLFLHHFDDVQLSRLLRATARQTRCFIACEPRRSRAALAGVSLMPLIRFSQVTRHDGRISVLAGFRNGEISALWPRDGPWTITERPVAPFTHLFIART